MITHTIAIEDIIQWGINDAKAVLKEVIEDEFSPCYIESLRERKRLIKAFEKRIKAVYEIK